MELDLEYLRLRSEVLENMSLEDFSKWKYLDEFCNISSSVCFAGDLEKELIKLERYDLLKNLKDETI